MNTLETRLRFSTRRRARHDGSTTRRWPPLVVGAALLISLFCQAAALADEKELNAKWRGSTVLLRTNAFSDCAGSYTDNSVRSGRAASRGEHGFLAGEIGRVHRINVQRKKTEVRVQLHEALLLPRREGHFTLYDEVQCDVELELDVGRADRDDAAIESAVEALLERAASPAAARESELWNGRVRANYPADYQDTLAQYEAWRREQINVAVADRIASLTQRASHLLARLPTDSDTMSGFGRGIDNARRNGLPDACQELLELRPGSWVHRPSGVSPAIAQGYVAGQELYILVEVSRRLQSCYI